MDELVNFIISVEWQKEWLGLAATTITLYSFSLRHALQFRQVNFVAAVTWISYGIQLGSLAMLITNAVIVAMHIWHLAKHYKGITLLDSK
ncbi:MAG: hypothetical protein CL840_04375 [Crocinitomicaceae bacterium]|jgi:hypothetical protein|nr:hypothetical protein [Crocinitomicaceae bacterium]|tara:strand:- start:94834 stop:95103 length:270 start_codon:yes stop_codon:yes gene_type:complete